LESEGYKNEAQTGADGGYTVSGLPTGNYKVVAYSSGYIDQYYNGTINYNNAAQIALTAPDSINNII